MKILFLVNLPSPYRVDFFNALGRRVDLTVLFERKAAADRDNKWNSEQALSFQAIFCGGIDFANDRNLSFAYRSILLRARYDRVVFGDYVSPTAMLAIHDCVVRHIAYGISIDGAFLHGESRLKYQLKRYLLGNAAFWLSTSPKTSGYLAHYGAKLEKTFIYPFTSLNDSDVASRLVSQDEKLNLRSVLGIAEEEIILSVGQFIRRKGFDLLLRAYAQVESEKTGLYIIGGEPTKEYLTIVRELDLRHVHFISFMCKQDILRYCCASDMFVMPTREDIWGLVVNEAMACGLPVISSDACMAGVTLIEDGVNGFIVPTENVDALADAMQKLLFDSERRIQMGENNLKQINGYTIEKMVDAHVAIFMNG